MGTSRSSFERPFRGSIIAALLSLSFGPIVWAAHLTFIYGIHTLACTSADVPVLAATVIGLVAISISIAVQRGKRESPSLAFYRRTASWLAWLSAFGVASAGAAALIVAPCLALR